jgi:kynurenine formamidase
MDAGIGTHIDSPAHCISGDMTVEHLALPNLIAPCVVIDVSHHVAASYVVQLDEVDAFEKNYGKVPAGAFVIIYTGWEKYWQLPDQYGYQYPTIDSSVATLLIERNIAGLGVDTFGPDGRDSAFQVHQILLSHGKYIIENVANIQQLPIIGSFTWALPMKAKGLTEAPIRLVGLVEKTSTETA